jgi:phage shock protein A
VARIEKEVVHLKEAVQRLEARLEREGQERRDLREQVLEFRRRLGELEGRVQEIEGRLSRG